MERKRDEDFKKALDATREAFRNMADEELEREVSRALSEVRARRRVHNLDPDQA